MWRSHAAGLALFLLLDGLWLGLAAKDLYAREVGSLLLESPRWAPALLFYLGYPVGVVWMTGGAVTPRTALTRGAVLGLLVYGTYDLTNLAVLKGWSELITVVDIVWGTCLTAVVAWAAQKARGKVHSQA
ncbi:DUF2177 family protein [Aquabacterium lacunae]|uniref:DUF2177 family protein n=1 Tax=Aquabacterium lacunae TaxID=2528630 RepID=A0A4Q9H5F3_9BURK|nr:DUF2177 family protein [Aquabacterium lacunae]TBO33914.1 DUF2177 family protein [Aquabacterium lacunae]